MSRRTVASTPLSLLDTLSCAFGGVIVLSVVFSATVGERDAVQNESYLVVDARIEPVGNTALDDIRKFALLVKITEPNGAEFPSSSKESPSPSAKYDAFSSGEESDPDLPFVYATLIGDQVPAGQYRVRLAVTEAPWETAMPRVGQHPVRVVLTVRSPFAVERPVRIDAVMPLCAVYNALMARENLTQWKRCEETAAAQRVFEAIHVNLEL